MQTLRKIAFLLEEFTTPSPAQQLLDRFLSGYPRDGTFHMPEGATVSAHLMLPGNEPDFDKRRDDFDLVIAPNAAQAVEGADAVVVASRKPGAVANDRFLQIALEGADAGSACFVHGALSNTFQRGREQVSLAHSRQIALLAGTPVALTWRLPEVDLTPGTSLTEALIVVQGAFPGAELHALEGLLPVIERRRGGESGVRRIGFLEGQELWRAGERGLWSRTLLASALSRSHTPQGDAVADGRTQDLLGLGLVPKLARSPRGWLLEHDDGLRSTLLVLDGVVADINFAVVAAEGATVSAQLFRAPPPAEHHFSRLAATMEDFFRCRKAPWPVERNLLIAGLLEAFARPATRLAPRVDTPWLGVSYPVTTR
ncbi:MAG: hypothetical protein DME25_11220 [Verrucomicrobia bacterium]|nr:MAG: hypothetical protein DME25_11220 [Verrucomicrobiota bacterium]